MSKPVLFGYLDIVFGAAMAWMCFHMMSHDAGTNWAVMDYLGIGIGFLDILIGVVLIAVEESK